MSGYGDYYDDEPPRSNRGQQTQGRSGGRPGKKPDLGSYTEVKVRIQEFYAKYPEGSLVTTKVKVLDQFDPPKVMVQALAFRGPDDELPGVGTSWMQVPGTTPYTRGSEVENCETSAWGRAIASLGIAVDKNIATADELRNKDESPGEGTEAPEGTQTALAGADGHGDTTEALPEKADEGIVTRVPRSLDDKTDEEVNSMTLPIMLELARERFIPSAIISKTARAIFGEDVSLRALDGQQVKQLWNALLTGEVPSDPAPTGSPTTSEPSTTSS